MKVFYTLILTLCIFSCTGPGDISTAYVDQESVDKKNYLKSVIFHPTPEHTLYGDFDVWNFTPLYPLRGADQILDSKMIEVVKNDSGFMELLIVHWKPADSPYIYSDTMFVQPGMHGQYTMHRTAHCPCETAEMMIEGMGDSIVTVQWYEGAYLDGLPDEEVHYLRSVTTTRKDGLQQMYMYFDEYYQDENYTDTLYYDALTEWGPGQDMLPFYDLVFTEKIMPDEKGIRVDMFTEGYNYSTDTNDFSSADPEKYEKAMKEEKYLPEHAPYFIYRHAMQNIIHFRVLNKTAYTTEPVLFMKYASWFWFLWDTRWRNNSFLCEPPCGN